jgi:DHA2 family multidrug resistance protein-like MFS transporter
MPTRPPTGCATITSFAFSRLLFVVPQYFRSVGATTAVGTGYGFVAAWIALLGIAPPTVVSAALGALTAERARVGSGLAQALRQIGGTVGVAVLDSGNRGRARTGNLAAALAQTVHDSVAASSAML